MFVKKISKKLRFPQERAKVKKIQEKLSFKRIEALNWAKKNSLFEKGDCWSGEISPTFRCPQACPGCPDSILILMRKIKEGIVSAKEDKTTVKIMKSRIKCLVDEGVKHFMFIGGTIDSVPELGDELEYTMDLSDQVIVSWFTDGIPQTVEETGEPTELFKKNLKAGWLSKVTTHLSTDYPYIKDLFSDKVWLPHKQGKTQEFKMDGEYSRKFKSQYGAICAKNLIRHKVNRVYLNMTVSPRNLNQVMAIYEQAKELQKYAQRIGSSTEVLWTFSPWAWRPHQTRGDDLKDCNANLGLAIKDMPKVNKFFSKILKLEYQRINEGGKRLLATSSGFVNFFADPQFRQQVVDQELPYSNKFEMIEILPSGDLRMDPMFWGPELPHVNNIFGYRDRDPRQNRNPFTKFQPQKKLWFPNLIALRKNQYQDYIGE